MGSVISHRRRDAAESMDVNAGGSHMEMSSPSMKHASVGASRVQGEMGCARWRHTRTAVLMACGLLWCLLWADVLKINATPSAPLGLYLRLPVPPHVGRGMLVMVPQWTFGAHDLYPQTMTLVKPIARVAGAEGCVTDEHGFVNREDYGPVLPEG